MISFEIFFHDLNEDAQKRLLETFETTAECENWEVFPLATIDREDDDDEATMEKILETQSEYQRQFDKVKKRIENIGKVYNIDVDNFLSCLSLYDLDQFDEMTPGMIRKTLIEYNKKS